jgi:hypothetical protein
MLLQRGNTKRYLRDYYAVVFSMDPPQQPLGGTIIHMMEAMLRCETRL